ncbi:cytochrome P450, partial [Byssothecium circinans]
MAPIHTIGLALLAFTTIVYALKRALASLKTPLPLPPGPKGLPIVGNINDLPPSDTLECKHYAKFKDLYGPLSSLTIFGNTIIIINDLSMAFQLLRDRASLHSSRPHSVFAHDMCGWNESTGLLPYGETLKIQRKNLAKVVGSKTSLLTFNRAQEAEAAHFLINVLEKPEGLFEHIRKEAASVVLKIVYGYTTSRGKDPLTDLANQCMAELNDSLKPERLLFNVFPFLRHLPSFLPFQRTAHNYRRNAHRAIEQPYAFVLSQLASKRAKPSYMSQAISSFGTDIESEANHKFSALSMYLGGSDTTVSSLMTFFLAMMCFPDVQKRAQEEIDNVIEKGSLPGCEDRERLPYIEAIVKETLRWHPVAPTGLPHQSTAEDIYRGYRIPKGSQLIPNLWLFTRDPAIYPSPETFDPSRYLTTPPAPDPRTYTFGFGRRICPGRLVADNALFVTIAQALAVFDIKKPIVDGRVLEPEIRFTTGTISQPMPYKVSVTPRSTAHEELIRKCEEQFPWEESDAEVLEGVRW